MTGNEIQTLLGTVNCYACYGLTIPQLLWLAQLRQQLLSLNPDEDLSADTLLANASCATCYGASTFQILETALLDRIRELSEAAYALNGFISAAGITDQTQIDALTELVNNAVANGWWSKCDLIYPFVGGNATAHSINLRSPSTYTITWSGSVTHDANGITGDGSTAYGNTHFNGNSANALTLNDAHLSVYRRTFGTLTIRYYAGALLTNGTNLIRFFADTAISGQINSNAGTSYACDTLRLVMVSRIDSATATVFTNSTQVDAAFASSAIPNAEVYVLANNSGGPTGYHNCNLAAMTMGSGFTLAEFTLMEADWQTFQTALGRQV